MIVKTSRYLPEGSFEALHYTTGQDGDTGQEETHDKCNSAIQRLVASRAQGAVTLPSIIASSGHGSEISTQDIYRAWVA